MIVYSLYNTLGIQFAPQLFSTVPYPTRICRQLRLTVTGENHHQKKYKVNNSKVSSLSLPGYLKISLPCLINVANHTDQNRTKGLYIPCTII